MKWQPRVTLIAQQCAAPHLRFRTTAATLGEDARPRARALQSQVVVGDDAAVVDEIQLMSRNAFVLHLAGNCLDIFRGRGCLFGLIVILLFSFLIMPLFSVMPFLCVVRSSSLALLLLDADIYVSFRSGNAKTWPVKRPMKIRRVVMTSTVS